MTATHTVIIATLFSLTALACGSEPSVGQTARGARGCSDCEDLTITCDIDTSGNGFLSGDPMPNCSIDDVYLHLENDCATIVLDPADIECGSGAPSLDVTGITIPAACPADLTFAELEVVWPDETGVIPCNQ